MYSLEQKIIDAFNSDSREIYTKAVFNNDFVIDGKHIKSFTINSSVGGTDALSLGNAYSNKLELDMFVPSDFTGLSKSKIEMFVGILINGEISYVPLGVFFADDVKTTDNFKSVKITAYDAMLKLNDLGNTYKCGNTKASITPVEIIEDIAKQAGVITDIPNSEETISKHIIQKAEGVLYSPDGAVYETVCTAGIKNLIPVSKGSSPINIKLAGDKLNDLQYSEFKAIYYTDINKSEVYAFEEYDDMTFGDAFDIETGDIWIEGTITPPVYDGTLYLGFYFNTSAFAEIPDLQFDIMFTSPQINYVNNTTFLNPQSVDFSARTMLGYMAGLLGCNAVINRSGNLTLQKFENNNFAKISAEQQFMNGFEQLYESPLNVEYLTTGTEPNNEGNGGVITVGNGSYGFNFENPYITSSEQAQNILNMYKGIQIIPCRIKYRGNPCIDCGDIIQAEDRNGNNCNVLVLSQTLSVTGGFNSTIDCSLKTDVKADFISTPSTKKLTQRFTDFERAYRDVISKLTGVSGGYVKNVYDAQGNIRAIAICENDIAVKWDSTAEKVVVVNDTDKNAAMWVWSYGGLSFTPNGGNTYSVAINMKGQIFANYLLSPEGTIGGWEITEDALCKDFGKYRAYIQIPTSENSWVFSAQEKGDDGKYYGNFYVQSNGKVWVKNNLSIGALLTDDDGDEVINLHPDFVFGNGAYRRNYRTYYEGGENFYLRFTAGGQINIQDGTTTILTMNQTGWKFDGVDSNYVNRDTISSHTALVLNANGGNNYLYLVGSKIHLRNDTYINGNVSVYGDAIISGDLHINWSTDSGLAPLYVDSNGVVQCTTSSKRYKENIIDKLDDELNPNKLYDLPVVQYNYKEKYKNIELVKGTQIGITAEDVEKYYPNALIRNKEGEAESWQDRIMIPAMLKLIQEQKQMIDNLEKRIEALEKRQN